MLLIIKKKCQKSGVNVKNRANLVLSEISNGYNGARLWGLLNIKTSTKVIWFLWCFRRKMLWVQCWGWMRICWMYKLTILIRGICFGLLLTRMIEWLEALGILLLKAVMRYGYIGCLWNIISREGIGGALLQMAESNIKSKGKTAIRIHLGEQRYYFESYSFYLKHNYKQYDERYMIKNL